MSKDSDGLLTFNDLYVDAEEKENFAVFIPMATPR